MKAIKKNVYYCDHCKKKGLAAQHIRNHEANCTANPNRYCKLCERNGISDLVDEFKARFIIESVMVEDQYGNFMGDVFEVKWNGDPVTLEEIRNRVDDCPNCIFSILRQTKMNYRCFEFQFDYKKELASALSERNDLLYRESSHYDW